MSASPENGPPSEDMAIQLAKEMANEGLPPDAILQHLVAQGVNPSIAVFIVNQHSGAINRAKRGAGFKEMAVGGLICLVGIAITVFTYLAADDGGRGRFIVSYGAMFVGGAQFIRGLVKSRER